MGIFFESWISSTLIIEEIMRGSATEDVVFFALRGYDLVNSCFHCGIFGSPDANYLASSPYAISNIELDLFPFYPTVDFNGFNLERKLGACHTLKLTLQSWIHCWRLSVFGFWWNYLQSCRGRCFQIISNFLRHFLGTLRSTEGPLVCRAHVPEGALHIFSDNVPSSVLEDTEWACTFLACITSH